LINREIIDSRLSRLSTTMTILRDTLSENLVDIQDQISRTEPNMESLLRDIETNVDRLPPEFGEMWIETDIDDACASRTQSGNGVVGLW
jgi:hypothetical protein